jgi:hypothetical protein
MTTSQAVLMGVVMVLFLNASVYGLRAQFLLLQNRADPFLSVLFGLAFWRRALSGDVEGLDQQNADLFLRLRKSFFISMAICFITGWVGLAYLNR